MWALADLIITGWPKDSQGGPSSPLSVLATQRDPHHQGWSSPVWWSTHHSSCQKGESPTSTASIPSRNNKVTVAGTWKFLLACHKQGHQRSSLPVWSLEACTWFQSQNAAAPLTPTPTPSCPWPDVCHRYLHAGRNWPPGSGWLLLKDDLCSMSSTQPEQCQQGHLTAERDVFRAWHPQSPLLWQWPTICECTQFTNFCISWGITHETSSLHYPHSNGFAEACIKSVKHALQWAKYSGANPHLALLALWATPIDTKLPSPAELLYQCWLRTTILAKIHNNDPSATHSPWADWQTCSEAAKSQADKCTKTLAPLYAGQPVAMYDTLQKIWVPATVIHILPWNSYQVCTSNGSTYCCMHGDTSVNTVSKQLTLSQVAQLPHCRLLTRHCFLAGTTCIAPTCTMHAAHIHCTCNTSNPDETGSSCSCHASCSKECPSTNACNIPCHTCAATKIQPCLHGTKMPDPGNLGTIDPDCPWTLLS